MALDEPKDDDEVLQVKKFKLVASKALLADQGGVEVDYLTGPFRKGFQIKGKKAADCKSSGCSC